MKMLNEGGRPIIEIDYPTLDKLCAIQCTGEECAAFMEIDYDTLNNGLKRDGFVGFSEYFRIKSGKGKISLRRKQYEQAESGNTAMLIWLGKQWLGQSEKQTNENINTNANYEIPKDSSPKEAMQAYLDAIKENG